MSAGVSAVEYHSASVLQRPSGVPVFVLFAWFYRCVLVCSDWACYETLFFELRELWSSTAKAGLSAVDRAV
jgi:hypothetical protein